MKEVSGVIYLFKPGIVKKEQIEPEAEVEAYLQKKIKSAGGRAYKFVSPGNRGVTDRLVLMPGRRIYFVELKKTKETPTGQQNQQHKIMVGFGFPVFVIDYKAGVDEFIETYLEVKKH